ncbi:MAG: hypothetical protein ACI8ZB_004192 [Desulforhopalus sp.]
MSKATKWGEIFMLFVKQKVSMILGLILITMHLVMTSFLWFKFSDISTVYIEKMALPISAAFSVSIVKWFIDNKGIIKEEDRVFVGLPYVILVTLVMSALGIAYVGGALWYLYFDSSMEPSELNNFYLFVQSTMGGMLALLFSDLYDRPVNNVDSSRP